jgi:hypothetical protein
VIAIFLGSVNPVAAEAHDVKLVPDIVHWDITPEPALTTKAVDPDIVIPNGESNPVPAVEHEDNVVPESVHEVTVVPDTEAVPVFVTNTVDPEIATPDGFTKLGGSSGVAAYPFEHVYLSWELYVYLMTVKHWYVTLFVSPLISVACGVVGLGMGPGVPVPVASGSHTVAVEFKHWT